MQSVKTGRKVIVWCDGLKENDVKERKMNVVKIEIQMTRRLASR